MTSIYLLGGGGGLRAGSESVGAEAEGRRRHPQVQEHCPLPRQPGRRGRLQGGGAPLQGGRGEGGGGAQGDDGPRPDGRTRASPPQLRLGKYP